MCNRPENYATRNRTDNVYLISHALSSRRYLYEINFLLFFATDILPHCDQGLPATREFLLKVVDILLDYVKDVNDRNEKVLNFRHPSEMMALLNLEVPDKGVTLQELIKDCHTAMKHQVKTGKSHP